jgi:hypothetical protein
MKFSGMTPNILTIFILEKEGEDFALKTRYFNHKEPFHFFRLQNGTMKKVH